MLNPRSVPLVAVLSVLGSYGFVLACNSLEPDAHARERPVLASLTADSALLIGAGDIASCNVNYKDEKTAALIVAQPTALAFAAGDLAYPDGTAANFLCYHASWGQFKARTRPALGNHDIHAGLAPFYDYWNGVGVDSGVAGKRGRGWYAVTHGGWRLLFMNTEYKKTLPVGSTLDPVVEGMKEQAAWIRNELTARPYQCVAMIMHRTKFSSVGDPMVPAGYTTPLYSAFYEKRGTLVISGHHHQYERMTFVNASGGIDSARGFRQLVAGGGGASDLNVFLTTPKPYSEKRLRLHGVVRLALTASGYEGTYLDTLGAVRDRFTGPCRGAAPVPTDNQLIWAMLVERGPVSLALNGEEIGVWFGPDLTVPPSASAPTAHEALAEAAKLP